MERIKLVFSMCLLGVFFISGCKPLSQKFYSLDDFETVKKLDVHFHYFSDDQKVVEFAQTINMKLLSPNTDAGESIHEQLRITSRLKKDHPGQIGFLGTFSLSGFGKPDFASGIIARIDSCMQAGASGIKIWKNIGMVLKDSSGRYVMADDSAFQPVFSYIAKKKIPLMGHLGEPKNCWLPADKMTLENDRGYFTEHPQYHMFLHPEAPSYENQIDARDNLLRKYPDLNFVGAHLASLEWNVDELARRLDEFPNLNVDFAARIGHLQYQSATDREKIRNFMIKYQDRLLYGTDFGVGKDQMNVEKTIENLRNNWLDQWKYLATDSEVKVEDLGGKSVKGLQLTAEIIDKIYYKNAVRIFSLD
jgi:hypothetical protein